MFAKFFQLNKCLKPKEVSLLPGLQGVSPDCDRVIFVTENEFTGDLSSLVLVI